MVLSDITIINTTLLVDGAGTPCIHIRAVDDDIIEAMEMFTVSVMWMPGDNSTSIPVTVVDNDRESLYGHHCETNDQ